ncbi:MULTISPECIES: hypothetical protein [unclassified Leucobacter]|uniref:hypothetical protein n=1 Tax=unclassified Leucobacter TaxID=2621730 RepID=UPI00165D7D19|nr:MULTISPECIES: hypothetical protein [unclassified Leucobacter]MBC9927848.1 hypothetical protein [Leucobacter sp. cx-169]
MDDPVNSSTPQGDLYRHVNPENPLAPSRNVDGAVQGVSRDEVTGHITSHAIFVPVDEPEAEHFEEECDHQCSHDADNDGDTAELDAAMLAIATALIATGVLVYAAYRSAPSAKRWFQATVLPKFDSLRQWGTRISKKLTAKDRQVASVVPAEIVVPRPERVEQIVFDKYDEVSTELRSDMSVGEAQERMLLMRLAEALIEEQKRALSTANIQEPEALEAAKEAISKISPQQAAAMLTAMRASSSSALDQDLRADLSIAIGDGEREPSFVPLRRQPDTRALPRETGPGKPRDSDTD